VRSLIETSPFATRYYNVRTSNLRSLFATRYYNVRTSNLLIARRATTPPIVELAGWARIPSCVARIASSTTSDRVLGRKNKVITGPEKGATLGRKNKVITGPAKRPSISRDRFVLGTRSTTS
jgi:hypothetical protein